MAKKFKDTFENIRKRKKKFLCFNFNFTGNYIRVSYVIFNLLMLVWVLSYSSSYFVNNHLNSTVKQGWSSNLMKNTTINNSTIVHSDNPNLIVFSKLVIPIIFAFFISLLMYFLVSFSDPGRIQDDLNKSNSNTIDIPSIFKYSNYLNEDNNLERKASSDSPNYQTSSPNNIVNTERNVYSKSNLSKKKDLNLDIENFKSNATNLTPKSNSKKFGFGFDFVSDKPNSDSTGENSIVDYEVKDTVQNNESESATSRQMKKDDNLYNSNPEISLFEGRYCMECHIDIPLRCKHCTDCGWCIATFDHHCSWTSRCIGEKNKGIFIMYLFFKLNYLCLVLSYLMMNFSLLSESPSIINYLEKNIFILVLTSICGLFIVFVFTLLKFQIILMLNNQTTWENYSWHKIQYMVATTKSQKSPFDKGLVKNIEYVFCLSKILKSKNSNYILWRKEVDLEKMRR